MSACHDTAPMELEGKRITLVGLGRSSVAAARLVIRHGATPFITEQGDNRALAPWLEQCRHYAIPFETGGHSDSAFSRPDMIVLSPGVPLEAACLEQARRRRIAMMGELELAWRFCRAKALAVTGTNGKTTVCTLVHAMLTACGHTVALAGNNDTPLSRVVMDDMQPDYVVLEVSSYQLETTDRFHPCIAAVLNITPDHLGRHGSMDNYAAMKARLFQNLEIGDATIRNADDTLVMALPVPETPTHYYFSLRCPAPNTWYVDDSAVFFGERQVAWCADNPLPGEHNMANVLAAMAMMHAGGFDLDAVVGALRAFPGVEHRIERVMSLDGVDYYNDSKSTNVDSLRVALESFTRPIVLIAGGRGKGSDYRTLRPLVTARVKRLIVFGEDGPQLESAYSDCVPVECAASMMDAVRRARRACTPGDVALLSPACASFDMYDNFEARGKDFKDCLRRLADNPGSNLT